MLRASRVLTSSKADSLNIIIPSSWTKSHPKVFASGYRLSLEVAIPPVLTAVIVVAVTDDSYVQACSNSSVLEDAIFGDSIVLRQGDILNILSPANPSTTLQYRLEMLEPFLQGRAIHGDTELMVLSLPDVDEPAQSSDDDEEDAIEIDEHFLGRSVLSPSASRQVISGVEATLNRPEISISGSSPSGYLLKALTTHHSVEDDHCTLYLRTSDLGRIGILSGDWVNILRLLSAFLWR